MRVDNSQSLGGAATRYAVVGAGPAGLAAVANILQREGERTEVVWVDESFTGGRLSRFPHVPSNTKVSLFVRFAAACHPKRGEALPSVAGKLLKGGATLEAGCSLEWAWEMVVELTRLLQSVYADRLVLVQGYCHCISRDDAGHQWRVHISQPATGIYTVENVVLATGCHPKPGPDSATAQVLDSEALLCPGQIERLIGPEDVVGLVGSSHTAILILRNLIQLADPTVHIINFCRSPLRFAEYLADGRIKHDNTGLKGEAAEWARQHLLPLDQSDSTSVGFGGRLMRIAMPTPAAEQEAYAHWLPRCTKLVWAIGYERNALPTLTGAGDQSLAISSHDARGRLCTADGQPVAGLYGIGIAFPERVTDPSGECEDAVGLWKFMLTARRIFANDPYCG